MIFLSHFLYFSSFYNKNRLCNRWGGGHPWLLYKAVRKVTNYVSTVQLFPSYEYCTAVATAQALRKLVSGLSGIQANLC